MNYWLVKSEPFKYSWEQFNADGQTFWDGVRNHAARLHLLAMQKGDQVLFYHSNEGLAVMGIAKVLKAATPDPTADDPRWVALVRIGRLSVMPLKKEEFDVILELSR
mgnify:CR=1 FL=1